MVTHAYVDLHIPEAQLLADLTGVMADLRQARKYAVMALAQYRAKKMDTTLIEALSIAAAVAYSRAFASGVRTSLSENDLNDLTRRQLEIHHRVRAYRDKHAAHSVNAFELNQPRAHYVAERLAADGFAYIGCSHARRSAMSTSELEGVIELANVFSKHVDAKIAIEQAHLLDLVRRLPIDQVLAGGTSGGILDPGARIDKPRKPLRLKPGPRS